jgi:hypothetical protein
MTAHPTDPVPAFKAEGLPLSAPIAGALAKWHALVAQGGLARVAELLHPDMVFRSPMAHHPYQGAKAGALILSAVAQVFRDFVYERQFASADGLNVVLEFRARVGERELKGVDLIRFDPLGLIREFEVMVRPASALAALGEEMARRVGADLSRHQAPSAAPQLP